MSSTPGYERYPQTVVATVYYATERALNSQASAEHLVTEHRKEFQEELAHWFGSRMLAYTILPEEVFLEVREGSRLDSSGAEITVVITGSVRDTRERKLCIALEEIHEYLRGHPLYQVSLLVRIQFGTVCLQKQSGGEKFEAMRQKPVRHWRQEHAPESDD